MTVPLFTHQCGGCKPLMDLHPALRDYHAREHLPDAPDVRSGEAGRPVRSAFRRAQLLSACAACTVLVLGSLVVF